VPRSPNVAQSGDSKNSANDTADEINVTPINLQRTLTNPAISSAPYNARPELTAAPGYRAVEAFVRPSPTVVSGAVKHYGFNLKKCEFTFELDAPSAALEDAPTIIFLPEFHFPKDSCSVAVSSGSWEIVSDDSGGVLLQFLRWHHDAGEQSLKAHGLVRPHNELEGTAEEMGYLQQCQETAGWVTGNCSIM
jgi:Glycoside hydrolase family 5 C-terminal domain